MATLYLRIEVWLVVVAGVVSGLAQSLPDRFVQSLLFSSGREAVRYTKAILRRYEIYTRYIARDFAGEEVPAIPDTQAASAVAG